jgi:hypothetical protein
MLSLAMTLHASAQHKPFPVSRGALVTILGADIASQAEARNLANEEGWIESPNSDYVVVVVRSGLRDPLARFSYESVRDLQRDVTERSSAGSVKLHCYIFQPDEAQSRVIGHRSELRRVDHQAWDVVNR